MRQEFISLMKQYSAPGRLSFSCVSHTTPKSSLHTTPMDRLRIWVSCPQQLLAKGRSACNTKPSLVRHGYRAKKKNTT